MIIRVTNIIFVFLIQLRIEKQDYCLRKPELDLEILLRYKDSNIIVTFLNSVVNRGVLIFNSAKHKLSVCQKGF